MTIPINSICTTQNLSWEMKLLGDFEIQIDHQITARRPDLVIINKKKRTCQIVDFVVLDDHRVKLKENEKRDKYRDLARELKKIVKHEKSGNPNHNWCSWYSHQRIDARTGRLRNKRTSGDHPNYYIIKISQNTEEIHGDLRRLPIAGTPVRNHRLTLV